MTSEVRVSPADWNAVVTDTDGVQLIVGGPGSGKTELLVRRVQHLIESRNATPDEIIVLSFSRRTAADLRTRATAGLGSVSRIRASTFHSLAMRIIEAHGSASEWQSVPTLLTGPEHVSLVAELLADEPPAEWPKPYRPILATRAFADEVADFILRAAERLEDADSIEARHRADWRGLPGFLRRYRRALIDRGRIDYGSLQAEAARLLEDPDLQRRWADSVPYVLVDEYQDTTYAQATLLRGIAGRGNITAAGDPYQSVYSFRGAELSNVAEFAHVFGRPDLPEPRRFVLTTSFRVPRRILEAAVRLTVGAGLPGAAGPMLPGPGEGSVETYGFAQHSDEAEWIASEIQRINLRDRVPYDRIAVLVRSKRRFLTEMSRALERRGIPHDEPDSRLVDHPAVRPILDLAAAACGPVTSESDVAFRRVLLGPLVGLTISAARHVERVAARSGWLAAIAEAGMGEDVVALLGDPSWAVGVPAAVGFWRVWTSLQFFRDVVLDPSRAEHRRALASFSQALDRLAERDPGATLADYSRMTESEDFEATPLLEYRDAGPRVTLTTLHQSKGKTFEVVFIADARDGVFPDLRTRDSLLGTRTLSPHGSDDAAYAAFRLHEERRLAYSSTCRATRRVVWTATSTGFDDGEGVPSRFIPLVAGTDMDSATGPPGRWADPTTPAEAEAWLRRRAADPGLPLAERLAALHALATPAPWRPRDPSEFAGLLDPGPDHGLVGDNPILSASQVDSYTRCPRRYVFERRLGVDSGGSAYQELGSLVHAVLERAETKAMDRDDAHSTLDEALDALEDLFDPEAFGSAVWAVAWKQRAVRILTRLYELWPGSGPAVGLELGFSIEHAGTRWTGRIDRVEQRGEGVGVVDYKTSTTAPRVDDAAVSLQLGLYVLGARASTGLSVIDAEFWYPAAGMVSGRASVTTRHLDLDRLADVEQTLAEAAAGIRAECWDPITGPDCERCSVRLVCPEWPQGREAYVS